MKAESFIKLMRTIINEEVRKVVREELRGVITEQTRPNLRDKYKDQFSSEYSMNSLMEEQKAVPLNKYGQPSIVNTTGNPLMNSILMETATQMRQDPQSSAFFEGLR